MQYGAAICPFLSLIPPILPFWMAAGQKIIDFIFQLPNILADFSWIKFGRKFAHLAVKNQWLAAKHWFHLAALM